MQILFLLILAGVGIQRILELIKNERHRKILLSKGGIEHAAGHYKWMIILHRNSVVQKQIIQKRMTDD